MSRWLSKAKNLRDRGGAADRIVKQTRAQLTDTWPPTFTAPAWKTSRTATKKTKVAGRRERKTAEVNHKQTAKKRDLYRCRFPLCGCKALGLVRDARLESSHHTHKGIGGDPSGERSMPWLLVTLCKHRHQDGAISRHRGTLRPEFLTSKAFDGIIAWRIDLEEFAARGGKLPRALRPPRDRWFEVARETSIGTWAPFTNQQRAILKQLAEMNL